MQCPVRVECGDSALLGNEEFGVWGGAPAQVWRVVKDDKIEQAERRHSERVSSYLEHLPPRSHSYTTADEITFDELEHPLDSAG